MGKMISELREAGMKNKKIISLIFIFSFLIFIAIFYQHIFIFAGDFLAPEKIEKAEAVVIESSELVREKAIKIGINLLSQGKANLLVVVFQNSPEEKIFGRPWGYISLLSKEIEKMGLKKDQIMVLEVPKEHPITLIEAQTVLPQLAKKHIKKIILLAESFHVRRSLWAYKKVGEKMGMKIFPLPFFLKYGKENWWQNTQGIREFGAESVKFLYYLLRGYIPLKSALVI